MIADKTGVAIEMSASGVSMDASSKEEEDTKIGVGQRTRTELRRWEYVLVFDDVENAKDGSKDQNELKKEKFEIIIKAIGKANVDMRLERYGKYIYCKIRLRTKTLREFADKNEVRFRKVFF